MKRVRAHLNYANIVATLALLFAMSGGALAAKHYLVSSPKQISPKVLNSLASTNTALFKKLSKTVTVSQAVSATTAATATNATNATNATHATSANTASTAGSATSATTANSATSAGTAGSANALNGLQIVRGPDIANNHETQNSQEVVCPAGLHAIGGGVKDSGGIEQAVNEMFIDESAGKANTSFTAFVNNTSTTKDDSFHVWVICATASISGADL